MNDFCDSINMLITLALPFLRALAAAGPWVATSDRRFRAVQLRLHRPAAPRNAPQRPAAAAPAAPRLAAVRAPQPRFRRSLRDGVSGLWK